MKNSPSELLLRTAQNILQRYANLVSLSAANRLRFENWLQLEIYKSLILRGHTVEVEKPFPVGQQRCDFWFPDGHWIELKLCVTNYCRKFAIKNSPRPITNQIDAIVQDVNKLAQIDTASSKTVLIFTYPMPENYSAHLQWDQHLQKIRHKAQELIEEFSFQLEHGGAKALLLCHQAIVN